MNVVFVLQVLFIINFTHALNGTSRIQERLHELSEKCARVKSITSTFEYTFMVTMTMHDAKGIEVNPPSGAHRGLLIERARTKKHVFCRGAIITRDWVLSAARCFDGHVNLQRLRVHAGVVGVSQGEELQIRFVERVVIHPEYESSNDENNIAMIKVGVPFVITAFVHPGYLPTTPFNLTGPCSIMRVNELTKGGRLFERLYTIQLQAINYHECVDLFEELLLPKPKYNMTTGNFCMFQSDFNNNSKGVCKTDVGGPTICMYQIQGVVSHSSHNTCSMKGYPSTITDVGHHLDWIRATIIQLNVVKRNTGSCLSTNKIFSVLIVLVVLI